MKSPYDPELLAEIRQRMSPPNRESVAEIARSTGVNVQTLYSWRHLSADIENWTSADTKSEPPARRPNKGVPATSWRQ